MLTIDKPSPAEDEVREEYFESQATGVEIEVEGHPPTRRAGALGSGKDSDSYEALLATSTRGDDR